MTMTARPSGVDRDAVAPPRRPASPALRSRIERRWGWILLGPALATVLVLTLVPIGRAIWTSLHQDSPLLPSKFTGVQNYVDVATRDRFLDTWVTTISFTVLSVALTTAMALGAAALLNTAFRGSWLVKPIALLPWAVPGVIAGVMWRWMFNDSWGPINAILYTAGLTDEYVQWLGSPRLAFLSVTVAQSWSLLPLATIFLLAAYQHIPHEQYEAARIDGASTMQAYRYVTLPNIRAALIIVVLYLTLMGLTAYDIVYSMTAGGPGSATTLVSYFTWAISFRELNFGQGAALAVMIAAVSLVFVIALLKVLPKGALDDE
jgi:ABC-type sugar transport system permease subunit